MSIISAHPPDAREPEKNALPLARHQFAGSDTLNAFGTDRLLIANR
jgi:hypothetical protein